MRVCKCTPQIHTTKPFAHQLHPQANKRPYLQQLTSYLTQLILPTHQHGISYGSTQCCSHTTAFHLQDSPYQPCPAATKVHNIHNPLQHATQTQHCSCIPHLLIKLPNHAQLQRLSIHNNMHYTPSTAHSTAFHAQGNPSVHTSNKHKALSWQNGTRCRDSVYSYY